MGVIYLKSNQLDAAEQTLLKGINVCSAKAYLKANLAKVYAAKGLTEKSHNALWESIELDPNQDNAVIWIGAIHKEKGGREEYLRIMRKVSEIPSSWRAQLWIARDYLDNSENENAVKIYQAILPKVTNEPDAMMMISGDLGKHGLNAEVMTMIYPLYDLNKQDYRTGLNIIAACIDSKNKIIGLEVLKKMKELNRYDITAYLARLENLLNQIKK
jgi:tetratricopeptide (TPR) repeat protein